MHEEHKQLTKLLEELQERFSDIHIYSEVTNIFPLIRH
jgi:hypothetical protein